MRREEQLDNLEAEIRDLKEILRAFIEDHRVLASIAEDCKGGFCTCLYCRGKVLV